MKIHRDKMATYFYTKHLKKKIFREISVSCLKSKRTMHLALLFRSQKQTQTCFYQLKWAYMANLKAAKLQRTHHVQRKKRMLSRILKAWLYLVRPSKKYVKSRPMQASNEVDKLLAKISNKKKDIAGRFKSLRMR